MAHSFLFEHWVFEKEKIKAREDLEENFFISSYLFSAYYLPLTTGLSAGNIALK